MNADAAIWKLFELLLLGCGKKVSRETKKMRNVHNCKINSPSSGTKCVNIQYVAYYTKYILYSHVEKWCVYNTRYTVQAYIKSKLLVFPRKRAVYSILSRFYLHPGILKSLDTYSCPKRALL